MRTGQLACGTCLFWKAGDGDYRDLGRCRRHPPVVAEWAVTTRDDWCGEYARRPLPVAVVAPPTEQPPDQAIFRLACRGGDHLQFTRLDSGQWLISVGSLADDTDPNRVSHEEMKKLAEFLAVAFANPPSPAALPPSLLGTGAEFVTTDPDGDVFSVTYRGPGKDPFLISASQNKGVNAGSAFLSAAEARRLIVYLQRCLGREP